MPGKQWGTHKWWRFNRKATHSNLSSQGVESPWPLHLQEPSMLGAWLRHPLHKQDRLSGLLWKVGVGKVCLYEFWVGKLRPGQRRHYLWEGHTAGGVRARI